jgi:hypothetical protein
MDKADCLEQQAGQCLTCGFLGKRIVQHSRMWPVFEADPSDRQSGNLFTQATATASHNETAPFCFRHKADLISEVKRGVADQGEWDRIPYDLRQTVALAVIEKGRGCPAWFPYTPGFTPKDHLEDLKMQELEQRRREFEQGVEERRQAFEARLEADRRKWESELSDRAEVSRQQFEEQLEVRRQESGKIITRLTILAIVIAVWQLIVGVLGMTKDSILVKLVAPHASVEQSPPQQQGMDQPSGSGTASVP